ncbi:MAG: cation-translocating P-type ATPase [Firmicutes bacterium]|nr:cation-translocating P-type ATPase [Bacillota bacterium]
MEKAQEFSDSVKITHSPVAEPIDCWHAMAARDVLTKKRVDLAMGLNDAEVLARQSTHGLNKFREEKKKPLFFQILHHLKDLAIIILIIAAILALVMDIAAAVGWRESSGGLPWIKAPVIMSIVIFNTFLAVWQERGAQKAMDALQKLNSPTCFVIRDGIKQEIDTTLLVPGDIIILKSGDLIPADARIIEAVSFSVDEASLTGESEPSKKITERLEGNNKIPLGDRKNMVFSGCLVANGNATAVVTETGMNTQMGVIADFLTTTKKRLTPLQMRVISLGRIICLIAVISAAVIFGVSLITDLYVIPGGEALSFWQRHDWWMLAFIAVTLAVAAVPEAMMVIVTLTLTKGMQKMVEKNVIIRQLNAVETLGSTSVICSDKTGTLTQNLMSITRMWRYEERANDPVILSQIGTEKHLWFLSKLLLASNVTLEKDTEGNFKIIGDPTESAIMRLCMDKGITRNELFEKYPRVAEIPFSSARKMMTTVVRKPDGKFLVLTKGAFDRLPFDRKDANYQKELGDVHDKFADDALRLIALAYKEIDMLPAKDRWEEELEKDLIFEGFIGIIDPPRPEAKASIAKAKKAGIRTIMITGDHAKTATAIARELGIISHHEGVITGAELAEFTDDELYESVQLYSVYARVSPEDKIRIVQAWKKHGQVVAMTGDGVNDGPALKGADVGVAMGIAGTEVAKSASDIILTDDNFTSIVSAVVEGRNVFANIRKLVYFLIVCNFAEITVMLFGVIAGWGLPVTPIMLLFINVLADGVPGLALAKEEADPRVMDRKPFRRGESFFSGGLLEVIIRQTLVTAVVTLASFYIGKYVLAPRLAPETYSYLYDGMSLYNLHNLRGTDAYNYALAFGQTMAFLTLGWASIIHIFTARSRKSAFATSFLKNKQMTFSALGLFAALAIMALIPWVNANILGTGFNYFLPWQGWIIAFALCFGPIVIAEYNKAWDNHKLKMIDKNRVGGGTKGFYHIDGENVDCS